MNHKVPLAKIAAFALNGRDPATHVVAFEVCYKSPATCVVYKVDVAEDDRLNDVFLDARDARGPPDDRIQADWREMRADVIDARARRQVAGASSSAAGASSSAAGTSSSAAAVCVVFVFAFLDRMPDRSSTIAFLDFGADVAADARALTRAEALDQVEQSRVRMNGYNIVERHRPDNISNSRFKVCDP